MGGGRGLEEGPRPVGGSRHTYYVNRLLIYGLNETKRLFSFVQDPEFLIYCYDDNRLDLFIKVWTLLYADPNSADYNPSVYLDLISPNADMISPEMYYAEGVNFRAIYPLVWLARTCATTLKDPATSRHIINALRLYARKGDDEVAQWLMELVSDTEMVIDTSAGEFEDALHNALQAISRDDISDKSLHEQLNNLANLYITMAEKDSDNKEYYLKAERILSELLPLRIDLLGKYSKEVAATAANLAGVYNMLDRTDEAIELRQLAMEVYRHHGGNYSQDVAIEYNNIANEYLNTARYEEALEAFEKSHDIYMKIYGPENVYTSNAMCGMILALRHLNRHEQMLDMAGRYLERFAHVGYNENAAFAVKSVLAVDDPLLFSKALDIIESLSDPIASAIDAGVIPATILINIGDFYSKTNLQEKAHETFDKAASVFRDQCDVDHLYFALFRKAMAYTDSGDYVSADEVCRDIMEYYEDGNNIGDPNYIMTIGIYARNQLAAGNLDEAEKYTRLNIELRQARDDSDEKIISQLNDQLDYIESLRASDTDAAASDDTIPNTARNDSEYVDTVLSLIEDEECRNLYITACDKYDASLIDEALILFENLAQKLDEEENYHALAHIYRYIALCREFSHRHDVDSAAEYYDKSIELSEWALDYEMCARTAKDYAEMYWNLDDFPHAITYYWDEIYYLFKNEFAGGEKAEMAFENIAVAITKDDPVDWKALLSLSSFAQWLYGNQPYFEHRGAELFGKCVYYAVNNLGIEDFEYSFTQFLDLFEYLKEEKLYRAIYALSMVIPLNEELVASEPEFTARMAYISTLALEKMGKYTKAINTAYKTIQAVAEANVDQTSCLEPLFAQLGYMLFDQRYFYGLDAVYPHVRMQGDYYSQLTCDITHVITADIPIDEAFIKKCVDQIEEIRQQPDLEDHFTLKAYRYLLQALIGVDAIGAFENLSKMADEYRSCEYLGWSAIAAVKAGYTTEALNIVNDIYDIINECISDGDRDLEFLQGAYDAAYASLLMDRKSMAVNLIDAAKTMIGDDGNLIYFRSSLDLLKEKL